MDHGPEGLDGVRVYQPRAERRGAKREARFADGLTWLEIRELDLKLRALPNVFTQVNPGINRLLVQSVLDICQQASPKRALDLYAGLGNFSQPVAKMVPVVTSVESNVAAVQNAKANMRANGLRNISIHQGEAEKIVKQLVERGEKFDLVIMDPPRAGARGLAAWLARLNPTDIIYVSCHPAALTRDLVEFNSLGYGLSHLTAFDMFPQTSHLEVLARLRKI